MNKVAITDANIFIDLFYLDLVEAFFTIDFSIWTTEEVMLELRKDQQDILVRFKVDSKLGISSIQYSTKDLDFNKGFSKADVSILRLGTQNDAIVLSGERKMKKWCEKRNIEIHGILWIFDQLIVNRSIKKSTAIEKLKLLLIYNDWLPKTICFEKLDEWKK